METSGNKRAVIVGIFVSIGIIILLVGIFTLSGQKKTFVSALTLNAEFDDIGGLQKGNNVWFSGVKVGVVKNVSFAPNGKVKVTVSVEEKVRAFIRKNSQIKLGSDGLIGNKIIVITGGTPDSPEVKDGDVLTVKTAVGMDEMMGTLQDNNKNLVSITDNFKVISHRLAEGEGTIGALLKDSTLYLQLKYTLEKFKTSAANTEKMTAGISSYIAQLDNPGTFSHELVTDTTIMANLKDAVAQIKQSTGSVNAITDNLKTATASFNEKLDSKDNAAGVILNDEATAAELKMLIHNLQTGSAKLDENMKALQSNFLFRGYFRKKEKRERKEAEKATQK